MPKIVFIGAGSYGFTFKLAADVLHYEALKDSEFAFMDVDQERLDHMKVILDAYLEKIGYTQEVMYTKDMEKALEGADFIFNLVRIGFLEGTDLDMDIPKKYGLYQTVGDTSGVGGIFRGIRTMIFDKQLCDTVEKVSNKGAVILNYTNPQMMLVMAAAATSKVPFIGLCHSVQGTTRQIAKYMEIPYEELAYEAAGVNHMSWVTKLERNGTDVYPEFRRLVKERGIFKQEGLDDDIMAKLGTTRLDMLNRVGYMVTESSDHFAEYVPYYLRTPEIAKSFEVKIDKYKENMARKGKMHEDMIENARAGKLPDVDQSVEFGPEIIHAMTTNKPCKVYTNVMNKGLVTNLPEFSAVEVACLVDRNGVQPCHYGALPTHLAALCRMEISVHQLTVEAFLKQDRKSIYWAMMMDPLTHSVLTIDQMEKLADELIAAHDKYLGKHFN